ncbi:MAG: endonuclease MutS2, partial [Candidatus Fimadaptatus sp.]
GKTVTLKTVGLFTLMAQAGLQVPAELGTELSVFDSVFADIGDEQSIEQSLSTFSSHMTNIVSILRDVTPDSLVMFDELGAGTDPTEGAALAMAILDTLLEQRVRTMATTHYSELKEYALSHPGVENASVEFNVQTLRPTYRLSIGIPGKSNAFEISRKLGLPEEIIEAASRRLSRDQVRFEDVISNAESQRQIAERERELAQQAREEMQRLRDETDRQRQELERQRENMLRKAREDARRVLQSAQRESEQIISELKRQRAAGASSLKEHELAAMRGKLQSDLDAMSAMGEQPADAGKPLTSVKIGDYVEITHLGTSGTVASLPDQKGEVQVQAGPLKLKVPLKSLRAAKPPKKEKSKWTPALGKDSSKASAAVNIRDRSVATETDVRGMNLEEAILAVDLYLDNAALQSLGEVYIIHGKGTGVLRAGIQDHLRRHPLVKSFRLGKYGEGEDGVTVVTLK